MNSQTQYCPISMIYSACDICPSHVPVVQMWSRPSINHMTMMDGHYVDDGAILTASDADPDRLVNAVRACDSAIPHPSYVERTSI